MNCCRHLRSAATLTVLIALAGAATLLLPGCGGGAPLAEAAGAVPAPASGAASPQAASAEPTDRGARTRQGLYLTAEQARALAQRLDDRLVIVEARCCGFEAAELDALIAFGVQAAANLGNEAPFVVRGSDQRQAAAVANRLAELGAKQVHLVTR
jgi:hypothetical protein